ncbi:phosphoglycerate mutase-like protein isoform X2 [Selaginella moellendorffii]|uniref:phosphoglycerate mutase-like protein isoform X2 n=1 Tax=Selaginella moellendorffii TaxID=88036 RepID=UPI000D1CE582|nr:phosphoglycerate mutase-like protein isoform X2 [Selaginella moellendorffii]|eukprot:XP_024534273.1 phosphoglycerate mutase-like protein isoform X2 [Selaginella moellendorffii]
MKVLHLMRHAQAYHNVDGDVSLHRLFFRGEWRRLTPGLLLRVLRPLFITWFVTSFLCSTKSSKKSFDDDDRLFDAVLTPAGWEQVATLRKIVREAGLDRRIQLVTVSPMTRTLQTATGVFRGADYGSDSSLPLVAVELCRERISARTSDRRRSISSYKAHFPSVDFSQIEEESDVLWNAETAESLAAMQQRIRQFLQWLWERKEEEIAVVSHSSFMRNMLKRSNLVLPNAQLKTVLLTRSAELDFELVDAGTSKL